MAFQPAIFVLLTKEDCCPQKLSNQTALEIRIVRIQIASLQAQAWERG